MTEQVRLALAEDVGTGDVTADVVPPGVNAHATVLCREPAVLSGRPWFDEVFRQLEPAIQIEWQVDEGSDVAKEETVCRLRGPAAPLLTGERTALNFLQTLSGTATAARDFARAVEGTKAIAQTVMSMIVPRVTFWLSSLTRQGGEGFDCPFGGSTSVGPDGSTIFSDCLLTPDFLLDGTMRITPGPEGSQDGRIEFDNFGGRNGGIDFSMDGFIEEIENPDSLTFRFDFDSTQTGGGYTDTFRFEGEIRVDDDGNMSGQMLSETNDLKSVCDFEGVNIFDPDSNPDIWDEICRDIEDPPS